MAYSVGYRWLGFLVIAFGAICAGIGGTHNFEAVAALRFFLGTSLLSMIDLSSNVVSRCR
jgi:hypothetical protein